MAGSPSILSFGSSNSLLLGRVFGIDVRIHYLWFLLPLLAMSQPGLLPLLIGLFIAVFLHELGHSLVAMHYGIKVIDITFWPLGGMARMSRIPEDSKIEAWIAIAGPAVNFVLAILCGVLGTFFGVIGMGFLTGPLFAFAIANVVLGGFNLLPAFPMDGGRILRAALGSRMDWVAATENAVRVGRYIAFAMLFLTFYNCTFPLLAVFIWWAGTQELMGVRMRHGISPLAGLKFGAFGGAPGFDGAGFEAADAQAEFINESGPNPNNRDDADFSGAERPEVWDTEPQPRSGFGSDEIARWENYRGRIGRRADPDED